MIDTSVSSPTSDTQKKQRTESALTHPPPSSAALTVLTDHALLRLITQFQTGIPLLVHELVTVYDGSGLQLPMSGMKDMEVSVLDGLLHCAGKFWASAMRFGDLAAVQLVCRMRQWPVLQGHTDMRIRDLPKYAVTCGRLDVVQWLHTSEENASSPWDGEILVRAIAHEHHELAKWLLANRPDACRDKISQCLEIAAALGKMELLCELIAFHPAALTAQVMDAALREAQWDVIHYLHKNSPAGCSTSGMDLAASGGHLDVVQFLHGNRTEGCTTQAMDGAALWGHLHVVQFLHEHRTEGCTSKALIRAAKAGHVKVVKFLHETRGMDAPDSIIDKVIDGGNMAAILAHHADVAKWMHEKRGVEVPERFTDTVLKHGKLAVVRYLHEVMNKPISRQSIDIAKKSKNETLIEYITSQVAKAM